MQIQPLSIENLPQLVLLVTALWPECTKEEEYPAYQAIINATDEACFLLQKQDTYIGFIHVSIRKDYVEGANALPVAYIEALYVQPAYQRLGLGKKLVAEAEKWGRQKGCTEIAADTELHNHPAIAFHQHLGFEEVNRIVCFVKKIG